MLIYYALAECSEILKLIPMLTNKIFFFLMIILHLLELNKHGNWMKLLGSYKWMFSQTMQTEKRKTQKSFLFLC